MKKQKKVYECKNCGHRQNLWQGQCPDCLSWGSLIEVFDTKKAGLTNDFESKVKRLLHVKSDKSQRHKSDYIQFDKVVGGGLIKDSVTVITARPGCGKSTLLLQLAKSYAKDKKVLYVTGEESLSQIKNRADRILQDINPDIWIIATDSMDQVEKEVLKEHYEIVIIDSIQTMKNMDMENRLKTPSQSLESLSKCIDLAKNPERKSAFLLVNHMTKKGELEGYRTLEHMVDTVLYLEGDSDQTIRFLYSGKNRFGQTGEMGFFNMEETGLVEINNPSEYFTTKRDYDVEGAAVCVIKEASRFFEVEIESIVSRSFMPYPQRIGDSLRKDELNTLITILQEKAGINLFDKNVIIKAQGGIRLKEKACDLAIMVSISSSFYKKSIDKHTVFVAEVGLTGELKKVTSIERRIEEAKNMGYKRFITAKNSTQKKHEGIEILQLATIRDVFNIIFK